MKLKWREGQSMYHPLEDAIYLSKYDVDEGWAPAVLAHELAHRREGILTHVVSEPSDRTFWKELAVWESSMERGLSPEEVSDEALEFSLGSHLDCVLFDFGANSPQYKIARQAYDAFKRKWLLQ